MDIQTLTQFFMWCTILNGGLLILSVVMMMGIGDFAYRLHSKWFPMTRETFTVAIYSFLGVFKILFIMCFLVPYIALLLLG